MGTLATIILHIMYLHASSIYSVSDSHLYALSIRILVNVTTTKLRVEAHVGWTGVEVINPFICYKRISYYAIELLKTVDCEKMGK
jgi:hypothetical protein